jgi:low temperature requirement protein LtrA
MDPKIGKLKLSGKQSKTIKKIGGWALEGAVIYFIAFFISEVLISGGLYERGLYFGLAYNIIILAMIIFSQMKRNTLDLRAQICRSISMVVTFAILDFLLVDLLLESFNQLIYKFWGTYVAYAIVLAGPVIYLLISNYLKNKRVQQVKKA